MTFIDQHTAELLAGVSGFSALSPEDAVIVSGAVEQRLLMSLCMTAPPTEDPDLSLWKQLLASAIVVYENLDYDGIDSESMRNYSYKMRTDSGTWADLSKTSGDLLAHFSKCPSGISMQTDVTWAQYGCVPIDWPVGGAV